MRSWVIKKQHCKKSFTDLFQNALFIKTLKVIISMLLMRLRKSTYLSTFFFVLYSVLLFFIYRPYANDLPRGLHTWAQSDRYSIAWHYMNGTPFFSPRTHCLESKNGRVGVEFPLVQFISGRIARSVNQDRLPVIYRFLTALILFSGFSLLLSSTTIPLPFPPGSWTEWVAFSFTESSTGRDLRFSWSQFCRSPVWPHCSKHHPAYSLLPSVWMRSISP